MLNCKEKRTAHSIMSNLGYALGEELLHALLEYKCSYR